MSRLAAALMTCAGLVDVVLGVAAISGAERLEANVREIQTSQSGGDLYFSLGAWGAIFVIAGCLLFAGAWTLFAKRRSGRLTGLSASFAALAASFFGLAIFRWPAVATVLMLLAAAFVLAYGLRDVDNPRT